MKILSKLYSMFTRKVDFSNNGQELFDAVLARLRELEPTRPRQHEPSMELIQEDFILGDLIPIALAIIAIKKSSDSANYIVGKEFQDMCMCASKRMADVHSRASAVVTNMMPKLPGLNVSAGHQGNNAMHVSSKKISDALSQISFGGLSLPADAAVSNLHRLIGKNLKLTINDAIKLYESV